MPGKELWNVIKDTGKDWSEDGVSRLSAALAYYTVLSLAPLLVLAVTVAGLVFGEEAARGQIAKELTAVVGPEAGRGIQTLLANAKSPEAGSLSSVLGIVALFFGASGVFGELQASLNRVWDVERKPSGSIWNVIRLRFFSFSMVLGVAFLLLVSLVLSAALAAVGDMFTRVLPGGDALWQVLNFLISLGVITTLFALIFKVVPDAKVAWRDVWIGAFATAVLFTIGKFGLDQYLGRAAVASPYGAAGSMIVLVIWVYYAAQIIFTGAEFTQAYARRLGSQIRPSPHAQPIEERHAVDDSAKRDRVSRPTRPHPA